MAGINAEVVVWVAEDFNTEHISAINHLNQISNEEIAFFCIKPRLIKIDNSNPAIEFLVVAKPDEWEKQIKKENKMSIRQIEYEKFWKELFNQYKTHYPDSKLRIFSDRGYYVLSRGESGVEYVLRFGHKSFFMSLYMGAYSKIDTHELFDILIEQKNTIEKELGTEVEFVKKEGVKSTKINLYSGIKADILSVSSKDKELIIKWVIE